MWVVEDLESSIDIVELVKRYTNLKKAWANYKAICPFPGHNEKTPSFIVSPSKQIGYCFGCHRGGWPLKFIMDAENCSFKEAIDMLSSITWVKVKWYDFKQEEIKKNIYWVFKDIVNYYRKTLNNFPEIKKYLMDRWLTSESIEKFEFGYSDSWIELYNYLIEKWYNDDLITQTNVFLDIKNKKDKFIWRIIFPIKNNRWDIVALAWRITWIWEPKYLNSPASTIYDKSSILYGLFEGRSEITKKDFIIITEWYMDAISLQQAWFKNTVCVSWTALTEKHIQIIKKLTNKIYLCFDNDKAWFNATQLSIQMLRNKDLEVKIISLENAKDPDEAIKAWMDFNIFINNALSPIWFELKNLEKINWLQDKKIILQKLLSLVKNYQDNIEKDYYLKEISQKLDIKLDIVYLEYNKTKLDKRENISIKKTQVTSQDLLIWYCIKYPEKIDLIKENLKLIKYIWEDLKNILNNWITVINNFEIDKKNKYIWISQAWVALEVKAWIETTNTKNEETIKNDILRAINKLDNDLLWVAKKDLLEKMNSWDLNAFKEYNNLLKIKK